MIDYQYFSVDQEGGPGGEWVGSAEVRVRLPMFPCEEAADEVKKITASLVTSWPGRGVM